MYTTDYYVSQLSPNLSQLITRTINRASAPANHRDTQPVLITNEPTIF